MMTMMITETRTTTTKKELDVKVIANSRKVRVADRVSINIQNHDQLPLIRVQIVCHINKPIYK
jgi:hypothetical protein